MTPPAGRDRENAPDLRYTFVIYLTDRPGAMELIAATFAHRGISLTATLGNDGTLDPENRASVLVHFCASPARKESLKRALSCLSRVVLLVEYAEGDHAVRQCALVRFAPAAPAPAAPFVTVEKVAADPATGDTYTLLGPPRVVTALLEAARASGTLRAATHTILAL